MDNTPLLHRLNRVQGQIEAIKKNLTNHNDGDCVNTIRLLKASINALKKFGQAYMSEHLEHCLQNNVPEKKMQKNMQAIIDSTFTL